jgi:hypothetical protein
MRCAGAVGRGATRMGMPLLPVRPIARITLWTRPVRAQSAPPWRRWRRIWSTAHKTSVMLISLPWNPRFLDRTKPPTRCVKKPVPLSSWGQWAPWRQQASESVAETCVLSMGLSRAWCASITASPSPMTRACARLRRRWQRLCRRKRIRPRLHWRLQRLRQPIAWYPRPSLPTSSSASPSCAPPLCGVSST